MLPAYELRPASGEHPSVELWSDRRLPFEPKGTLLQMREDLRHALLGLQGGGKPQLQAVYSSAAQGLCDAENVLFYNVGAKWFRHLAVSRIRIVRQFGPPPPAPSGRVYAHHCAYHLRTAAPMQPESPLVELECTLPGPNSNLRDPWRVWQGFKTGRRKARGILSEHFGAHIQIAVPRPDRFPLVELQKAVIDGMVASLHVHDGTDLGAIAPRLAKRIGVNEREAADLLLAGPSVLPGSRRLAWLRSDGIHMNPGDDRLIDASLAVVASADSRIHLMAHLFER